jgi:MoaA/NifB/PqqE/SkfB family radical SAM enzyme
VEVAAFQRPDGHVSCLPSYNHNPYCLSAKQHCRTQRAYAILINAKRRPLWISSVWIFLLLKELAGGNMLDQMARYYNSARIFRFFSHHTYIYKSIVRDLLEKRLSLSPHTKPRNIVLKLHSKCNAKCEFCYAQNETKVAEKPLTLDDWKEVIDQARALGCYTATFSGGEPLIYPHLVDLIEYVKSRGMVSFTSTNGVAVTEKLLKRLERAGLCALNWSLHGPRQYHDDVVGIDGAFDKILEYGEYCARRTSIICIVNHVVTHESMENQWYSYVWNLMKPKGFRALNLLPICISTVDKSSLLTQEELDVYDELAKRNYVLMDTKNYSVPLCPAAREDLLVNDFGDVQPCPFIPISFGNIRKSALKDAFVRMQNHAMFAVQRNVCMPARDHDFIDRYILPAFRKQEFPADISTIREDEIR